MGVEGSVAVGVAIEVDEGRSGSSAGRGVGGGTVSGES